MRASPTYLQIKRRRAQRQALKDLALLYAAVGLLGAIIGSAWYVS